MAGFKNLLSITEICEIGSRYIYALMDNLVYITRDGYEIIIPKGFQTDLASVPRLPVIYSSWGDRAHREAVLHDYLYRIDSVPVVSRAGADMLFKEAMISRGQPWHIYYPMYIGVRTGGAFSYHKYSVKHKFM